MVGMTLVELRQRVEALASDDGAYYVVCGRTGERPVPVAGKRFDDRGAAQGALRATVRYRRALRRYDPRLPYYDLIVCEAPEPLGPAASGTPPADDARDESVPEGRHRGRHGRTLREPDAAGAGRRRIEFCHRVAGSVFEALSDDREAVERGVMDAYFEHAESVSDPDDLCLRLLESMATEFAARLDPREQAAVLADAAAQLTPVGGGDPPGAEPVRSALVTLSRCGLVGEFTCAPATMDRLGGSRSVLVRLSEFALSPVDGRLPVLPVVVELYRHRPAWSPSAVRVAAVDDEWRVTVEFDRRGPREPLASAPIGGRI